jgi:hypothetical protein
MNNSIKIELKNRSSIQLDAQIVKTTATNLKLQEIQSGKDPVLLDIEHGLLNTYLDLRNVAAFVLLYFSQANKLIGATYSEYIRDGGFSIITQSKKLLLLQQPVGFDLSEIASLIIEDKHQQKVI